MPNDAQREYTRWLTQLDAARSFLNELKATMSSTSTGKRAQSRRQLRTLKNAIDALQSMIEGESDMLSEHEKNRRRNIILGLREERDVLTQRLSDLGTAPSITIAQTQPTSRETEQTAVRSNAQLLQLHRDMLHEQDEALDHLERSVGTTKRIALGVYEESELQNRLLDDFDEEVGLTSDNVYNVRQRVRRYIEQRGCCGCYGGTGIGILFVIVIFLMIVLVVVLKLT